MKSSDLDKFSSLSEVDINGSELIVTSTKMSIIKNAYIKELWRYSNNTWKRFKGSESKNFLNAKYSRNQNYLSYIEVEKDKDEKPNFKLIV